MTWSRFLFVVLLCVCSARSVLAQQAVNDGSVSGRVGDVSGAAIPGAEVTARHVATNVLSATTAGADGRFRFPYLRVGEYEIAIRHPGFAPVARVITVTAGAAFELPFVLPVGGLDATVTVTVDTPSLDTARSQVVGTVSEGEIRSLPLNGRNFLDVALLVPGVSPTNVASTQLFPETSAVPGISLSIGSQRNLSNNFIVDGLSANDDAAGLSGMAYGPDAVEQFQVVTSGAQAELGRALGGVVSVVTRSGTNRLQGTAYEFFRDDRLNASNALSGTRLPMRQSQYGGSLGGPIVADRTFYFVNAEQRRFDQSGLTSVSEDAVRAVNARLAAVGYGGPVVSTGRYPNPIDSTNVLVKVDQRVSDRQQIGVRYSFYGIESTNARGAGGLSVPTASSSLDNVDHSLALHATRALSGRAVIETRGQVAYGDLDAPPTDRVGPTVAIAGVATFGTSSTSPTGRRSTTYQAVNNVSYLAGAHALRAGVDLLVNRVAITFPRSIRGSYTFSSLANFLAGTYNNAGFTQTFGATGVTQLNPNVGMYLQDEWKLGSRLTANLGVRYDLQHLDTIATDLDNIAPRLGVAWVPSDSRRLVVRASAGLFYDRVPLRALANALLSAGNTTDVDQLRQVAVSLSPGQAGAPVFPAILDAAVPSVTLANLTTMDRRLQNASSRQASVEVERQLGASGAVSLGYQYLRGVDLLMAVNQNVPGCVPVGTNNGCRPIAAYANNSQYSSVGKSNYHGLHLSFTQRPVSWGSYRVSYTLSRSMNNLGEFFFSSPIDPFDLSKDWGRSDDDQRHRFVAFGTLRTSTAPARSVWSALTRSLQASGTLQTYSALPLNITSGVTTVQGTAGRPIVDGAFIPRNAGTGNDFLGINLRLSREFGLGSRIRLEAVAETFNVTNRRNVITRNGNFGAGAYPTSPAASFGQITAVGEPRGTQLGVRVRF